MLDAAKPVETADEMRFASAFGLNLDFGGLHPPGAWMPQPPSKPTLQLALSTRSEIEALWSGCSEIGWQAKIDGAPFRTEIGRDGDHRFVHGQPGAPCDVHHLSADGRLLRCAPRVPEGPLWWRVVLDSVLFTIALLRGRQALHAAAVATPAGVIAITAPSGAGKSTLLAELLHRGLPLLADDIVALEPRPASQPLAHPAPPLMTLPARPANGANAFNETIALIDDERWVPVPVHPLPMPLAAIVLLDRNGWGQGQLRPAFRTLGPLVSSLLRFPRTSAQEQARFEFASELSERVPTLTLSAPPTASPARLVELMAQQEIFELTPA